MNKAGNENKSVRNTKRRLKEVLLTLMQKQPIHTIAIKELARLAQVNRGTFYFHYSDVYALLHEIEETFLKEFAHTLEHLSIEDNILLPNLEELFVFAEKNKEFFQVMLGKYGDLSFLERLGNLIGEHWLNLWCAHKPDAVREEVLLYTAFFIKGCSGLLKYWLDSGMQQSSKEIAQFANRIAQGGLPICIGGKQD